jgi:hypothetical protein
MRTLRLLRFGVALAALGGVALIAFALAEKIPVPLGVIGAGLLFLLAIPLLLFLQMTIGLRVANVNRTLDEAAHIDPPPSQKVGQNPS